jgi:hypothetical protein
LKNYPNQASSFPRIKATLRAIQELNDLGVNTLDDDTLGYELARRMLYTFSQLDYRTITSAELEARITLERAKSPSNQGGQTNARELRRTLRDMGWLNGEAAVTAEGVEALRTDPASIDEQALLVAGLLRIEATNRDGSDPSHPVQTLLRLLAVNSSLHRTGLELALEPRSDSQSEFERVRALYALAPALRQSALGISKAQRDNAVKIFPTLAVTAGLVVEEDGLFSLTQDGWRVIGQAPSVARASLASRPGRRKTVGRIVTVATVASRKRNEAPRTLSAEEQQRANARLGERTDAHRALVTRVTSLIGDHKGTLFADEFSYDLFWLPDDAGETAILFEMKTITGEKDSYARAKDAIGQLTYYDYFWIKPTWPDREVVRIAAFDRQVVPEIVEFFTHEGVGVLISESSGATNSPNEIGQKLLDRLQGT